MTFTSYKKFTMCYCMIGIIGVLLLQTVQVLSSLAKQTSHSFARSLLFHVNESVIISTLNQGNFPLCVQECAKETKCLSFLYFEVECVLLQWLLRPEKTLDQPGILFENDNISNLALNKNASQSSAYPITGPKNAVNGLTMTQTGCPGNAAHTYRNNRAVWWKVDLGFVYNVVLVRFQSGSLGEKARGLHDIDVTTDIIVTFDHPAICGFYKGPPSPGMSHEWIKIYCPPFTMGQYVKLQKRHILEPYYHLVLCEVEVLGF